MKLTRINSGRNLDQNFCSVHEIRLRPTSTDLRKLFFDKGVLKNNMLQRLLSIDAASGFQS